MGELNTTPRKQDLEKEEEKENKHIPERNALVYFKEICFPLHHLTKYLYHNIYKAIVHNQIEILKLIIVNKFSNNQIVNK